MRVLLLGVTGNLGTRCVPALLAYHHDLTLYVRSPQKLKSLFLPAVLDRVQVTVGDATDSSTIRQVLIDHRIEGIVNVAGNQVPPWEEPLLPKIAKAVSDAALSVGSERIQPLRLWLVSGLNVLKYPGTQYLLDYYCPRWFIGVHTATKNVIEPILIEDLRWSLICVTKMYPANPKETMFDLLKAPRGHSLLLKHTSPPAWEYTWMFKIPWIGPILNLWYLILVEYNTILEDVADFIAGDLESGSSSEWVGKKVGMRKKDKVKAE